MDVAIFQRSSIFGFGSLNYLIVKSIDMSSEYEMNPGAARYHFVDCTSDQDLDYLPGVLLSMFK